MGEKNSKRLEQTFDIIPGLILCFIVIIIAIYGADLIGFILINSGLLSPESKTPGSSIFIAIIIGLLVRNTVCVKPFFNAGISFFVKYALRARIILLVFVLGL